MKPRPVGLDEPPITYFPEIETLGDAPRFHGAHRGDQAALLFEGRRTTYAQFDGNTSRVANGLLAAGLKLGSRVGYLGKNSDCYFEVVFGAARAGAVLTPINWRLAEPEIVYIAADADIEVLFVDADCAGLVRRIAGDLPCLRMIISMAEGGGAVDDHWETYPAWRDRQSAVDQDARVSPDDVAVQLYTSGTTGRPKGVQLVHRNFYAINALAGANPAAFGAEMNWDVWDAEDVSLVALPNFHISGTGWGIVGIYSGVL